MYKDGIFYTGTDRDRIIRTAYILCCVFSELSGPQKSEKLLESDVRERQKRESSRDQGNRQPAHTLLSVGR